MWSDKIMSFKENNHGSYDIDLQDINALPAYMAKNFILLVKVPSKHLGGLVDCVFYLHGYTPTCLRLFNDLHTFALWS